ncbi:MAG TPA: YqxA family protein [Bacillaceae bacterium]
MRFMFKCLVLVFVLFAGILMGMQKANEGMLGMKGYQDGSFQAPVHLKEAEEGQLEAALLGNDIPVDDLAEKKRKLEELESYNFFSSLGKGLAETVTAAAHSVFDFLSSFL